MVEQPNLQTITIPREDINIDQSKDNSIEDTNNKKNSLGGKIKSQEKYLAGYQEVFPVNPANMRGSISNNYFKNEFLAHVNFLIIRSVVLSYKL